MALGIKIEQRTVAGESVYIRSLNGGAMAARVIDLLQQVAGKPSLITEIGSLLVVCCLCDESGNRLQEDPETVAQNASIGFLSAFTEAALDVSGLGDDAKELAKNA